MCKGTTELRPKVKMTAGQQDAMNNGRRVKEINEKNERT